MHPLRQAGLPAVNLRVCLPLQRPPTSGGRALTAAELEAQVRAAEQLAVQIAEEHAVREQVGRDAPANAHVGGH